MAKKSWLDMAKDVATDVAISAIIPGGILGKAAYAAGKEIYQNLSEDDVPNNYDLAWNAYVNSDYENALEYLHQAKAQDEIYTFEYYRLCGMCHFFIMANHEEDYKQQAKQLGLSDDSHDDDPRWKRIAPLKNIIQEEKSEAYDLLKESLNHKNEEGFVADNDSLASVYWALAYLCDTIFEQRRYDMAAMTSDEYRKNAKADYKSVTKRMLNDLFDDGYLSLKKIKSGEDPENYPNDEELIELNEGQLFSNIDYHERQFVYIAKNVDALAGCYSDNIQWLFTIDALPMELQFPIGHPQPNSLYYAHPAKRGVYLPIEDADDELFNDKVRDFQRLAQCLGATEITFRFVKGHSLSESMSKSYDVEIGGGYKGYEGSVGYGNKRSQSNSQSMQGQREMVQRFNPSKSPYIPDDIAWLSVDPEWQSLVKQRLEGNMLHYSIRISSRKTMAVTNSRMDDVKVAFKSFIASAHVNYSQQMERSFQREEETEWEISVVFKPLEELPPINSKNEIKTEEPKESSIESYKRLRVDSCILHYCSIITYDDESEKPDLKRIINRVRKDTNLAINENDIKGETKQDVYGKLVDYLVDNSVDNFDWYGLIPTLPHENEKEKFFMDVDYESNIDNKGGALVGVVTSGSIVVGDKVLLSQYGKDSDEYECIVTWIEVNGKDVNIAKAGDSLGMGIDADFDSIGFRVECVEKSAEWKGDNNVLSDEEQQYLDNLKEFLEDDAEITPRERRMLDRIRQSLGISEERAAELEASLKPKLTEDEQEYLDMYKEYAEKGDISEKERRKLNKIAIALGINEERIKEIEQSF